MRRYLGAAFATAVIAIVSSGCGCDSRAHLERERDALLAENAALEARLSMSRRSEAYLVADIGERLLTLELQGVTLVSQRVHHVSMNRAASDLLSGRDRSGHLGTPYRIESQDWRESPNVQALRDSARIRPDTTGALMGAIRTSPVTAHLEFDRGVTLVLEGWRVDSFFRRSLARMRISLGSSTGRASSGGDSIQTAEIHLLLSPADVRSLSPNLKPGSRLVLAP